MLITVGIPFYNAEATLGIAIRSVFAQTIADWELILIDDGSKDRSLEIARSVHDKRVRVISDGENRGVAYRRNQLGDEARAGLLAMLDDDDVMHPERLERQLRVFDAYRGVDLVGSAIYTITCDNKVSGVRRCRESIPTAAGMLKNCDVYLSTITATLDWVRRNQFDEHYWRAQDRELFCRTFESTSCRLLPEPLAFYREGRSRTIRKYRLSMFWDRRVFIRYGPRLVGWPATLRLIGASFVKAELYRLLWSSGLEHVWMGHRRNSLEQDELAHAQAMLDTIAQTEGSGLRTPDRIAAAM